MSSINKISLSEQIKIYKEYQSGKYYKKEILDKYYLYDHELTEIINKFKDRRKPHGS